MPTDSEDAATILIVEDDDRVRKVLRRLLEVEGFIVEAAEDGLAALVRIGQGGIDLVVTDDIMPNMTGTELIERLQRQFPLLPILRIGGRESSRVDGIPTLPKPFSIATLSAAIRELVTNRNK